ncbi:lysozyme-like domain-containing protein [Russula dissimulans]|nr:lysozyme-like domain-containing protein [Russula dissimulans]
MKLSFGFVALSLAFSTATVVGASSFHDDPLLRRGNHPARNSNSNHTPAPQGVINPAEHGQCNPIGATSQVTTVSGPNGNIKWLNCGIDGAGWSPAPVQIHEIVVVSLDSARHTTFASCSDEAIAAFKKYGAKYGIPEIIFASFAMQESYCNPNAVGGAGEQGLMQITPDKCKNAPNHNCKDIDYNVGTAAAFFSNLLDENCGDIITTVGGYNGWNLGMTYADATRIAKQCCRCQNNLDYVHQFFNGWLQGENAYHKGLGVYHNVDHCS